jgi:hypothetical protein
MVSFTTVRWRLPRYTFRVYDGLNVLSQERGAYGFSWGEGYASPFLRLLLWPIQGPNLSQFHGIPMRVPLRPSLD